MIKTVSIGLLFLSISASHAVDAGEVAHDPIATAEEASYVTAVPCSDEERFLISRYEYNLNNENPPQKVVNEFLHKAAELGYQSAVEFILSPERQRHPDQDCVSAVFKAAGINKNNHIIKCLASQIVPMAVRPTRYDVMGALLVSAQLKNADLQQFLLSDAVVLESRLTRALIARVLSAIEVDPDFADMRAILQQHLDAGAPAAMPVD